MTRPIQLLVGELANREKMFVYQGSETVSGYKTIQTGLDECIVCIAELDQAPSATHDRAVAVLAAQATEPGQVELQVWKPTSISTNATPTTAATAAKVKYIAIGRTSMTQ